jgi:hypothetical protein
MAAVAWDAVASGTDTVAYTEWAAMVTYIKSVISASDTVNAGTITATTGFVPDANDGAYLGTTSLQFSDLFLAEGAVINWDNGDATLTQVGNAVTLAGADLLVTTAGTAATSVATLQATQTLTNKTLSAPTITGDMLMSEGASMVLDAASSADGSYSGITRDGTAGATLAFGDLIYLDPTDSRWELADANSAIGADGDARGILGICVLSAAGNGSATKILLWGIVRADAVFPALTINAQAFVGENAGDIVVAAPTTSGAVVRSVGVAWTADELFFNPPNVYFEAP